MGLIILKASNQHSLGKCTKTSICCLLLVYIDHPFIKKKTLQQREYQLTIARRATRNNTLVVLPTGMGKTIIALLVIAKELNTPQKKIVFLAPTKPLVTQHTHFLQNYLTLDPEEIVMFNGEVSPEKRKEAWENKRIIVSTPQVIENDLISRRIQLDDVSLIVFDEVHRTVGNYAYVFIGETYQRHQPRGRILGMTASPGNDPVKIKEVCHHLSIDHVEIRSKKDPDVRPYVHHLNILWKEVELPKEYSTVLRLLQAGLSHRLKSLKELGVTTSASLSLVNRKKLLEMQRKIQEAIRAEPHPQRALFTAASTQNAALKLYHGIELLQTQGKQVAEQYFKRLASEAEQKGGSKASKTLMKDEQIKEAIERLHTLSIEHPKLEKLTKHVQEQLSLHPESKLIIFTHYRDTATLVEQHLAQMEPHARPIRFIGQAGKNQDKGLSQKQQADIIAKFRNGTYNVLVATSVAEEGLDIPSTDLVIFFEPVPSEIRTIQRRGRTGRKAVGKVIILITKGTPDEGYYWAAKRKEKRMHSELDYLRKSLQKGFEYSLTPADRVHEKQKTLSEYGTTEKVEVIVDHRESKSTVARYLGQQGALIETKQLDIGDYVVSTRIGVERKTVDDYLSSLIQGKLFSQLKHLREAYSRPMLIIEGQDILTKRNMSHKAVFGSFSSTIVDYGIPIMMTRNPKETADFLFTLAKREQRTAEKSIAIRGEKYAMSPADQQQFIIEGLPNISSVLAKRLLHHFGTIRAIMNAQVDELCEVQGIGKQTAETISELLNKEYSKE